MNIINVLDNVLIAVGYLLISLVMVFAFFWIEL